MPASVASPYQALYRFKCSPLLLLPGSLARIIHRRASLFLIKLLWNVGKADEEEVEIKRSLYRRNKILHRSVYSALWLGGLRSQYRRQTNGPLAARCPCVMAKKKKHSVLISASANRENARYARLQSSPVSESVDSWSLKRVQSELDFTANLTFEH